MACVTERSPSHHLIVLVEPCERWNVAAAAPEGGAGGLCTGRGGDVVDVGLSVVWATELVHGRWSACVGRHIWRRVLWSAGIFTSTGVSRVFSSQSSRGFSPVAVEAG